MKATTRGIYALKAMLTLAAESDQAKPIALHVIAKREGISAEFLQQIFFRLRKAGLIAAFRGPGGGFYLLKDKNEISVLSILEAAGEQLELSPCMPQRKGAENGCRDSGDCCAGRFWSDIEDHIRQYAASRTLGTLLAAEGCCRDDRS
jgi:Rrf2 family iron-sulfur cluster assembly transcriptional regulator